MPSLTTSEAIFETVFLETRAKILEVAATLDRLDRADGGESLGDDPRLLQIRQALDVVISQQDNRAEQIQLIFSDDYEADWKRPGQL